MKLTLLPAALLLGTALPGLAAPAGKTKPAAPARQVDPQAKTLLTQMTAAYAALKSFSANISTVDAGKAVTAKIAFRRPDLAASEVKVETKTISLLSDGKFLYMTSSADAKKYAKVPVADGKALGRPLLMAAAPPGSFIGVLLGDPNFASELLASKEFQKLTLGKAETLDGVTVQTVTASGSGPGGSGSLAFTIGQDDHLLRRVTFSDTRAGKTTTESEQFTDVKVNPDLPDTLFQFTAPEGATAETPTDDADKPTYDPRLKVGADPFPFQAKDLTGKPVSLDDYKGKVVLLDFWATWCPPCREEIPNVVAAYKRLHSKGFEILGISLDQANEKAHLIAFLAKNGMTWRQVYDGKYWQSAVATQYGVQAIPFTLLIGKDGKIAAVEVRGPALAPAIQAALAK